MSDVTVLVADDHSLVRESVTRAVMSEPGFNVVGQAADGHQAILMTEDLSPDIIMLDITMPGVDGIEAAAHIRRTRPATRILMLTMHDDDANIRAAMALAVDGYLTKGCGLDELIDGLESVAHGTPYFAADVAQTVMKMASGRSTSVLSTLTGRETEILRLLALGGQPATIAEKLHLSVKTVKNHLTMVYAKLDVHRASQAVAEAYRLGLVSPSSAA